MWRCRQAWTNGSFSSAIPLTSTAQGKLLSDKVDHAEKSVSVIGRSCAEEQLVHGAIGSGPSAEFESPDLFDLQSFSAAVAQSPEELSSGRIKCVDDSIRKVVADKKGGAERSKVLRC